MRKLLLLSLSALALVAAGCGNDVPTNGVAKVGDTVITKASFDHWLGAAAKGQQAPGQTAAATVPDAPKFTKCAAAKAQQKLPKGAPKPTPKQLTDQCKQEYDGLKDQVLQFLISSEWIQQEA
ncbi:MAG: hypothetical protein H0T15_05090, partial [Thermoleophilaceae bacterium]|nr:hypothetical protein [Thermoleophilaceae bacterium]